MRDGMKKKLTGFEWNETIRTLFALREKADRKRNSNKKLKEMKIGKKDQEK